MLRIVIIITITTTTTITNVLFYCGITASKTFRDIRVHSALPHPERDGRRRCRASASYVSKTRFAFRAGRDNWQRITYRLRRSRLRNTRSRFRRADSNGAVFDVRRNVPAYNVNSIRTRGRVRQTPYGYGRRSGLKSVIQINRHFLSARAPPHASLRRVRPGIAEGHERVVQLETVAMYGRVRYGRTEIITSTKNFFFCRDKFHCFWFLNVIHFFHPHCFRVEFANGISLHVPFALDFGIRVPYKTWTMITTNVTNNCSLVFAVFNDYSERFLFTEFKRRRHSVRECNKEAINISY